MGYRVEYDDIPQSRRKRGDRPSRAVMTGAFFLAFLLLVNLLWPQGRQVLRRTLFPGDAVTVSALEELAEDLKTGEELNSALESFCRRILEDGYFGPP